MIDLNKTYKTANGCPVKLFELDNGHVLGICKDPERLGGFTEWHHLTWNAQTGYPSSASAEDIKTPRIKGMKLVEQTETKQVSCTIYVDHSGACHNKSDVPVWASFTVNAEVEKGSDKTYTIIPAVEGKIVLSRDERRALEYLLCMQPVYFYRIFSEWGETTADFGKLFETLRRVFRLDSV